MVTPAAAETAAGAAAGFAAAAGGCCWAAALDARLAAARHASARSAIFLERDLAVMLSQEIEETLVIPRLHVEEPRHDLVVAARFFQAAAHDFSNVRARDLAVHEERIDGGPERLALLEHALVEIVGHGAAPLALRTQRHRILHLDLRRQMLD